MNGFKYKGKRFFAPALAAALVAAMAFTFSGCSAEDGEENSGGGGGGGKGNDIANYKTVTIGDQVWMAENLNYNVAGSECYGDSVGNCNKYGRLYDWSTAMTVCPSGWHLPSTEEWDTLADFVESDKGCSYCAGTHLKAKSSWYSDRNGLDSYGFAALPGGYGLEGGIFFNAGNTGYWWSASEHVVAGGGAAYSHYMNVEGASYWHFYAKSRLFSVRCVKD